MIRRTATHGSIERTQSIGIWSRTIIYLHNEGDSRQIETCRSVAKFQYAYAHKPKQHNT